MTHQCQCNVIASGKNSGPFVKESKKASERQRWREQLRAAGLKCTEQRLVVLQALAEAKRPLSHREMIDRLSRFGWDAATIFRNLNDLFQAGFLTRLDAGDHVWRFELKQLSADASGHPHFLCVECGSITCLDQTSNSVTASNLPLPRGTPEVSEILLKGRCRSCL